MKKCKKILSILLATAITVLMAVPAFAAGVEPFQSSMPIVRISGDGEPLYDADNNQIIDMDDISTIFAGVDNGNLQESVLNVLQPFLIDGLITGNYDKYYAALEKEIGELFEAIRLDNNGDAVNGVGISKKRIEQREIDKNTDKKGKKGYYHYHDYYFIYDWRLDPFETADVLNDYIKGVKEATGQDKVAISSSCLGGSSVMAYISKYGTDDINGVSFDGSTINGAECLSEPISGKFALDGNAINRMIADLKALGSFDVDSFVTSTIDLLSRSGAIDAVANVTKETIYYTVLEGVTSALALSTFYTFPNYWACVTAEDYETALNYVFGEEGSEKRTEYANLIAKIENYDVKIRQRLPEILQSINNDGVNLCIISKYGFQLLPICESRTAVADQFMSVNRSSIGATASDIYGTLSPKYIAQREAEGKGKYISPDKQIDASTCLFPDFTWFTKGSSHSNWTPWEENLMAEVITADKQLTIDDFSCTQFMVYDNETKTMSPMTEENCNTYNWTANEFMDSPSTKHEKIYVFVITLLKWLKAFINKFFVK